MNLQSSNFIMFLFSQTIAVSSFFHVFVPSFFPSFPMIFSIPQVLSAPNGPPTVPQRSPKGPLPGLQQRAPHVRPDWLGMKGV